MSSQDPTQPHPLAAHSLAAHSLAASLLVPLQGLDLTSADGRCGIKTLLAEIERLAPGAILQQAATIQLRRLGCGSLAEYRDRG